MLEYAALVASPRALPDGLILVFQHPVKQTHQRRRGWQGSAFAFSKKILKSGS